MHRDIGIDSFNLAPHGLAEMLRVATAPEKNHRVDWRELPQGNIYMRHIRSLETVRLDIASHADNREPMQTSSECKLQLSSERVLVRPVPSGEGLVDHRNGSCFVGIQVREISSRDQRNFHGAKVLRIDHGNVGHRVAFRFGRLALNGKGRVVSPGVHGQSVVPGNR